MQWSVARCPVVREPTHPGVRVTAGTGDSSDGDPHTGVCGFAHTAASNPCADEVPIEPPASARARISQLGSISESSDRAGLMR